MTIPKRSLSWRLRVMMAERNITTATELQRLLEKSGYHITSSQLTRIIKERPERLSTDLLDHLLDVLKCDIGDLLRSDLISEGDATEEISANEPKAPPKSKKSRTRRAATEARAGEDLTGPKVTAFPVPSRK
ncbi:MAG: helix-turn-helix transcriptional regulator [Sulfuricella sp.]